MDCPSDANICLPPEKLNQESNKMIGKYRKILVQLNSFLNDPNTNIDDVTWIKVSSIRTSTIYEGGEHIIAKNNSLVTCTVAQYMTFISSYCSFFNFELLKDTIDALKYEEGKCSLVKYEKEFADYVKRRVLKCPSGLGVDGVDHTSVYVKLDDAYKGCRLEHLLTLKEDLCEILNLEVHIFPLEGVESGCVCVVFHLPLILKDKVFPSSLEQVSALKLLCCNEARVLRISCGDYSQEVNHEQGV